VSVDCGRGESCLCGVGSGGRRDVYFYYHGDGWVGGFVGVGWLRLGRIHALSVLNRVSGCGG